MNATRRQWVNRVMMGLTVLATLVALVPLFFILSNLLSTGVKALDLNFFTQLPKPVGEPGGGMANALVGSGILLTIACALGLPLGILGGIHLAEYQKSRITFYTRFMADLLNGVPSIVIGIFVYAILVIGMKSYSALAGGVALGLMMIPTVMRTTEEMLKLVPRMIKEAGLALGIPYWKVILFLVVPAARKGIVTGVLLAIARIAGETAPLLFTALGNQYWSVSLTEPISALPLQIFVYAISPYETWHQLAWGGALILIGMLFVLNLVSRFSFKKSRGR